MSDHVDQAATTQAATTEAATARFVEFIQTHRSWDRWDEPERGAINLITPSKRVEAAQTVVSGRAVSLGRPLATEPARNNPRPANHYLRLVHGHHGSTGGHATDYVGLECHGQATTHVDALCHIWDDDGLWGGRDPKDVFGSEGASWGGVEAWVDGITTRGVFLDIPRLRGVPYVEQGHPVTGEELQAAAAAQGVEPQAGDAVVVYSGRDAWERDHGPWGDLSEGARPGLHASCVEPLRTWDCAVLVWDMMDAYPTGVDVAWAVHAVINQFGIALVDNARLDGLAAAVAEEARTEFLLTVNPLHIPGGTGSAVNPVAIL